MMRGHHAQACHLELARRFGRSNMKSNKNLDALAPLLSNRTLKPKIDGPYTLEDAPRLVRYFGEGKHSGKVVMEVATS